ncbi:proton-conducting transporter transmembrane domain-containing protein, partial [Streptomyces shenzhenensis]|uniref:proton-conducting transporter transmembrane domain-containing protein n=1 Tax=Streptomyces shenzhenensis TaxID=943815 RepID=UPI0028680D73
MHHLLPLLVAVPLLGATLLVAAGRRLPRLVAESLACAVCVGTCALALVLLLNSAAPMTEWVGGWRPAGAESVGIVLIGDGPALGTAALVSLLTLAALAYSWRYFAEPPRGHAGSYPALILIFQAGMCGFAIAGDLFNAFVFFELMSVVAYALTGYRIDEAKAVQGALTFGVVNSLGAYGMLLGIGLLYARTGELAMTKIGRGLDAHGRPDALVLAAFVLVLTALLVGGHGGCRTAGHGTGLPRPRGPAAPGRRVRDHRVRGGAGDRGPGRKAGTIHQIHRTFRA